MGKVPVFDYFYLQEHSGGRARPLYEGEHERLNRLRFVDHADLTETDCHFLDSVSRGLYAQYGIPGQYGRAIPLEHQAKAYTETVNRFQDGDRSVAIFWEQGLGKSKLALMLLSFLARKPFDGIRRVLLTAPGAVTRQWAEQEIPTHWADGVDPIVAHGDIPPGVRIHLWKGGTSRSENKAFGSFLEQGKTNPRRIDSPVIFFLVNIEAFSHIRIKEWIKRFLSVGGPSAIVVDESSTIKNGHPRPKHSRSSRGGSARANFLLDISEDFDYRMILSGTPTPQSPVDLWSQFEFLQSGFWNVSRYSFNLQHTITRQFQAGGRTIRGLIDRKTWARIQGSNSDFDMLSYQYGVSRDVIGHIKQTSYDPYRDRDGITRKISPMTLYGRVNDLFDLPARRYIRIDCPMRKVQQNIYNDILRDRMVHLAENENVVTAANAAAATEKLLQVTGGFLLDADGKPNRIASGKLERFQSFLEGLDPDESTIYWAYHQEEQKIVYSELLNHFDNDTVAFYDGRVDHEVIQKFKDGEVRHLVSGSSLSFGHNFQHCRRQLFWSNGWRGDIRDQQEARTHRIGQTGTCFYYDFITTGTRPTIDAHVFAVLKGKADLLDYFRGGLNDAGA